MKTHGCWRNILISLGFILLSINLPVRGMDQPGKSSAEWNPEYPGQGQGNVHLIVFGDHLAQDDLQISLKTNPGYGEEWQELGEERREASGDGRFLKYNNLSLAKYFGHDIRENYLPMRISCKASDSGTGEASRSDVKGTEKDDVRVRAIYVIAVGGKASSWSWSQWKEKIIHDPAGVESLSLASHVRPRPRSMIPGQSWTVHVQAPVRHLKPGVQEVRWLDILFR